MHALRDLAAKIEALAKEHPAYSQAHQAVQMCCSYLTGMAGYVEANQRVAELEKLAAHYAQQSGPKVKSAFDTLPDDYELG